MYNNKYKKYDLCKKFFNRSVNFATSLSVVAVPTIQVNYPTSGTNTITINAPGDVIYSTPNPRNNYVVILNPAGYNYSIGYVAFASNTVISVTLAEGLTSIAENAFYGNWRMEPLILPSTLTSIGDMAFYGCSAWEHIVIPASVTNMANSVFAECGSIQSATFLNPNPSTITLGSNVFYNCSSLNTIYVPDMYALRKYQKHSFWGSLPYILEAIDKTPIPRKVMKIKEIRIKQGKVEIKPRK